jgi:hypothetical protein
VGVRGETDYSGVTVGSISARIRVECEWKSDLTVYYTMGEFVICKQLCVNFYLIQFNFCNLLNGEAGVDP